MNQKEKDRDVQILHMIQNSEVPMGAWAIAGLLEDRGVSYSPATIGRILNRLERQGYLTKSSFRGRMITRKGVEQIRHARQMKLLGNYDQKLNDLSSSNALQHFLMVLEARKTVERDVVRLAARNMTDKILEKLERIEVRRQKYYDKCLRDSKSDLDFHYAIAEASKNEVFVILSRILCSLSHRTELFDFMAKKNGKPFYIDHREILQALRERDADKAENAMMDHIDTLLVSVRKWWDEYHLPEEPTSN